MKNVLILGLLALLLFSVSATLSLWLNQPQPAPEEAPTAGKVVPKKAAAKEKANHADEPNGEAPRTTFQPKAGPTAEEAGQMTAQLREQAASLREREGRIERRQAQLDLILQDVRTERQALDNLRKQLAGEMKLVADKITELEKRAAELEQQRQAMSKNAAETSKRQSEQDEAERKNIERMALMYETMPAESAARIFQQMADMGRLDTVVKMLLQMKERQAAKVLAEVADPALAAQILEKMRGAKRSLPPAATTPAP